MKKFLSLTVIVTLVILHTAFPQNKIKTSEAENYIGKIEIVEGFANQVYHARGGTCFIDMDGDYLNNVFAAVIFKSDLKKFKDIDEYEGKEVEVKGTIKEYGGKPEIVLRSVKQIKIIDNGEKLNEK